MAFTLGQMTCNRFMLLAWRKSPRCLQPTSCAKPYALRQRACRPGVRMTFGRRSPTPGPRLFLSGYPIGPATFRNSETFLRHPVGLDIGTLILPTNKNHGTTSPGSAMVFPEAWDFVIA